MLRPPMQTLNAATGTRRKRTRYLRIDFRIRKSRIRNFMDESVASCPFRRPHYTGWCIVLFHFETAARYFQHACPHERRIFHGNCRSRRSRSRRRRGQSCRRSASPPLLTMTLAWRRTIPPPALNLMSSTRECLHHRFRILCACGAQGCVAFAGQCQGEEPALWTKQCLNYFFLSWLQMRKHPVGSASFLFPVL
jgi:hypothetical protein